MIGRIIWTAALLGIGAVTAALQLDFEAGGTPSLAPIVPAPLRSYAQTQVAVAALQGDDPAAGLAAAEALVRRRPMPAENLAILAAAQAKAGDLEAAGLTIQIAGQRGWREPLAQEAVLRLALDAGDQPEAARRYAALFRSQATPDSLLISLAPEVFGEPRGPAQETFATVIAAAPRWQEQFLQRGAQVMPPQVFAEIAAMALERRAEFPCVTLTRALEALRQRDAAAATRLAGPATRRCTPVDSGRSDQDAAGAAAG